MLKTPKSEIADRLAAFQALLAQNQIDTAVIRQNTDLYYLTGTVQDAHLVVPASGPPLFLVKRDPHRAREQSPIRPVEPLQGIKALPEAVFRACGTDRLRRIGMELDVIPAKTFFFYDEKLFPKQQIVDVSGLVRNLRTLKSPWEIEMMRGAAEIAGTVADAVPHVLREGMTELELTAELESVARKAGHLGILRMRAFNMEIFFGHVLSGPDAASAPYSDAPTGGPGLSPAFGQGCGRRAIRANEIVSVDFMSNHNGYLNDQTRNYSIGPPPENLRKAYDLAREIHERFRERARPGAITGELYSWIWEVVEQAGWAKHFMGCGDSRVSFVGHGLGLEVDELPFIARAQNMPLKAGMTFALEPKFILPGEGIAGLENTYLITEDGAESFNTVSEELFVL